jgi:transcriptional regulator with XRE-family HTH domain
MRHTLAILRTTIGLTQKELAVLTGRAARTVQAIELGQLPLSEELALRIAKETGVDEGWLLEGDTSVPPQMGRALLGFARERRPYRREDYEWQRAFNESPTATVEELASAGSKPGRRKAGKVRLTWGEAKVAVGLAEPVILESLDEKLIGAMESFLKETRRGGDALLVRWKLRRLLESLAKERKIELPARDLATPVKTRQKGRRTNIVVGG